jgi:hypothetical protein
MVVAEDARTMREVAQSGDMKLKDGANPVPLFGIRLDGVPKAPDNYYLTSDIAKL